MTAKEVITNTIQLSHDVLTAYLGDLTDDDLLVRPVVGANHIAWQLGHLIVSENGLSEAGYAMPALPKGFAECHDQDSACSDDPQRFSTKDEYLRLLEKQRAATMAGLANTPEEKLDEPAPDSMREYAPTIGAMFNTVGLHEMMHAAQFALIRRKLGRSPLF